MVAVAPILVQEHETKVEGGEQEEEDEDFLQLDPVHSSLLSISLSLCSCSCLLAFCCDRVGQLERPPTQYNHRKHDLGTESSIHRTKKEKSDPPRVKSLSISFL